MKIALNFILLFFSLTLYSQSASCDNPEPFCAGDSSLVFPNTTGNEGFGSVQCLVSTPNPAWFYIQIDEPGDLNFEIIQSTGGFDENGEPIGTLLDVDFALWGPYDNIDVCVGNTPPTSDIIDCSYLPDAIEFASINNAQVGEFYIMLITNFDGSPGSILLKQTSGDGATDCSILNTLEACEGDVVSLDATTDEAVNYTWEFNDGGSIVEIANGDIPILEANEEGNYIVTPQDSLGNDLPTQEFNLVFKSYIELNLPEPLEECETEVGAGFAEFNLQEANTSIFSNTDDASFSYYLTEEGALNENSSELLNTNYTNTQPYEQTIFVRVESSSTCASVIELSLKVNLLPEIDTSDENFIYCAANFPETITLEALNEEDPLLYDFLWSTGETSPTIEVNSTGDYSVDIKFAGEDCAVTKTFEVEGSQPSFTSETLVLCDTFQYTLEQDEFETGTFTWFQNNNLLAGETDSTLNVNVSQEAEFPVSNTYTLEVDLGDGSCIKTFEYDLTLNKSPDYNEVELVACIDFELDYGTFNLENSKIELVNGINGVSPEDITLEFYESREDALNAENEISNPQNFENTDNLDRIFVIVEGFETCITLVEIQLFTFTYPNINPQNEFFIYCLEDFPETIRLKALLDGNNSNNYDFLWSTSETSQSIEINQAGIYTVEISNSDFGCSLIKEFEVRESNMASFDHTVERFSNLNNTIEIIINPSSLGDYEFAINDPIHFQESNTFEGLSPGIYKVFVRDLFGCGMSEKTIGVLGIMDFFTPNGDGVNEVWKIAGQLNSDQEEIHLQIFDRYGKLMKSFTNTDNGWDGTFNGKNMPSDDYWYRVRLTDGTIETGHFTLKR